MSRFAKIPDLRQVREAAFGAETDRLLAAGELSSCLARDEALVATMEIQGVLRRALREAKMTRLVRKLTKSESWSMRMEIELEMAVEG